MFTRIFSSVLLSLVSTVGLSIAANTDTCQGVACFSKYNTAAVNNELLQKATKVAWRPGHYQQGSRSNSNSSSGGGWFSGWSISVPRTGPANPRGTFVFYPGESKFAAYDSNGDLVKSGRASGGMSWCSDVGRSCRTPVGTFRVHYRGPVNCISRKYPIEEGGGAPMPHCMYFNGGYAIHGSSYVPSRPASHGCIRLQPSTAEWMYHNFLRVGTVVKVKPY